MPTPQAACPNVTDLAVGTGRGCATSARGDDGLSRYAFINHGSPSRRSCTTSSLSSCPHREMDRCLRLVRRGFVGHRGPSGDQPLCWTAWCSHRAGCWTEVTQPVSVRPSPGARADEVAVGVPVIKLAECTARTRAEPGTLNVTAVVVPHVLPAFTPCELPNWLKVVREAASDPSERQAVCRFGAETHRRDVLRQVS